MDDELIVLEESWEPNHTILKSEAKIFLTIYILHWFYNIIFAVFSIFQLGGSRDQAKVGIVGYSAWTAFGPGASGVYFGLV